VEKKKLKELTPATYLGLAAKLATGFNIVDMNYRLKKYNRNKIAVKEIS